MAEVLTILKKELTEMFRDKSTFLVLFIPVMLFPIFNIGMEYLNKNSETDIDICISCSITEVNNLINQFIDSNDILNLNLIESNSPETLLKNGNIDCYITVTEKRIDFIYNSSSFNSLSSTTKLIENFQQYYNSFLSESNNNIFQLEIKDEKGTIANPIDTISSIFVPIVLVMLIFQNTSSFANDLFAGEKERKTLELLLLSGVKKHAIYFGKSLSLVVLAVINLLISLIAYCISSNFKPTGLTQFKFMQNGNSFINMLFIFILLLAISLVSVFISVTISMLSKNMKNSQILNEFVLSIPVGIMTLLVLGIINGNVYIFNYIPLLNLLVNLNNAFLGNINIGNIVITLISNTLTIGVLITSSIHYMKTEKFID